MVSFLSLALFSLFIQSHIVSSQNTPYSISFTARAPGGNILTLQCKGQHGTQVDGASFYRNGQNITNSSCLISYPTNTSSVLRIELVSQECDGFFSCSKDQIFSEAKALYACPIRNNSDRTISTQEGDSVFLTCDFPLSPINRYHTTWIRSPGSFQVTVQNTSDLQGYTKNDLHQAKYVCQINPVNRCFSGDFSHNGPNIDIRLIERFGAPKITEDLNYTRNNNGDGVFSVTSRGTNLTHKWYKNGGLINSTGDSILEISDTSLRVKETNGSLRIAYVVSNVGYDNTSHSMRQTFGVYSRTIIQNFTETAGNSMSIINVAIPMGITIVILFIICIVLFIICIVLCKVSPTENIQNEASLTENIQNEASLTENSTSEASPSEKTPQNQTKLSTQMQDPEKHCKKQKLINSLFDVLHKCIRSEDIIEYRGDLRNCREIIEAIKDDLDCTVFDGIKSDGKGSGKGLPGGSSQLKSEMYEKYDEMSTHIKELLDRE